MKLYICYGLFPSPRPGGHPCKNVHAALKEAGHDPEVVRTYGLGLMPQGVNAKTGRGEVIAKTGQKWVPVLELDDGTTVYPSRKIIEWAKANPARQPERSASGR
jgi:hypothetical protein